jgi:anti-sigma factor RsiW
MNCREAVEFLMDYLNGELGPDVRALFDEHLGECPECVAYLAAYRQTIRVVQLVNEEPAPLPNMPEGIVQAILAARGK